MAEEYVPYWQQNIGYTISSLATNVLKNLRDMRRFDMDTSKIADAQKEARMSFAQMLKYYEYAFSQHKKIYDIKISDIPENEKKKIDEEATKLADSKDLHKIFSVTNLEKTINVFSKDGGDNIRSPGDYIARIEPDGKVRFGMPEEIEAEQKHRAGLLTGFLEGTASKSFAGKLKSWFVGNSTEYKEALDSLRDFSRGEGSKKMAIEKITKYLDIRKSKVRDHQYGRDRFQGFMESLQTLMDPQQFKEYCDGVNKDRKVLDKAYDPRHVQPQMYTPTNEKSVLGKLLEQDTKDRQQAKIVADEQAARQAEETKKINERIKKGTEEFEQELNQPVGEMTL